MKTRMTRVIGYYNVSVRYVIRRYPLGCKDLDEKNIISELEEIRTHTANISDWLDDTVLERHANDYFELLKKLYSRYVSKVLNRSDDEIYCLKRIGRVYTILSEPIEITEIKWCSKRTYYVYKEVAE